MKRFKKEILLLLCAGILATAAGCSEKKEKVNTTGTGEIPESVKIFCGVGAHAARAGAETLNDLLPFQLIEKMTGCHVEWVVPSTGTLSEKFNMLIASGNWPDMIVYNWQNVQGGVQMYAEDEVIIPLTDLMEENMPSYTKYLNENPDMRKGVTYDDGQIYYAPFIRKDKELCVYLGPQIRRDWLDKLGLEAPTNPDELYEVLKAFKTGDPNGNGENDEIPMTGAAFANVNYGIGNLLWAFDTHWDFYVKDGKITYGIAEEEFEEGLRYIAKLYEEELIDKDFLILDRGKMNAKMMNDSAGFAFSFQPTLYQTNIDDGTRRVEGIAHLQNKNGVEKCYLPHYNNRLLGTGIVITTTNENPVGSAKWIDTFYSDEGTEIMNFGQEGLTYNWVDGYPKLTDYVLNNPEKDRISMCALNLGAYESSFPTLQDWRYYEQTLGSWGVDAINTWKTADSSGALPTLLFTQEESGEIAQLMTQVSTYVSENINKMAIGAESIDKLPEVREKAMKMGLERVLEIYNDSYKRYLSK